MRYKFEILEWTKRNQVVASLIPPKSRVLDLGGGAEHLKKHLVKPKKYVSIDEYPVTSHTMIADFNRGQYPEAGRFDVIVAQGILEYLDDIPTFLEEVKKYGDRMIVTYFERAEKMELWANNYSFQQIEQYLVEAGWQIVKTKPLTPHNVYEVILALDTAET